MKKVSLWLVVAAMLGVAGCAAIPRHETGARMAGPYPLKRGLSSALGSGAFRQGAWPDAAWWRTFGDRQLDRLMAAALKHNPDLSAAAARVRLADQQAAALRAATLPALALSGDISRQRLSGNGFVPPPYGGATVNEGEAYLKLDYDLDWWNRNAAALKAGLDEQQAAAAAAAEARLVISSALAQAYFRLQGDLGKLKVARDFLAQRRAMQRLIELRMKHGLETALAARQAEAESATGATTVAGLKGQVRVDRAQVAALAGRGPDAAASIQPPHAAAATPFPLPRRLSLDLLGRRPDLMALRWRVEAAAQRIGVARTGFYPDINLAALAGVQSIGLPQLLRSGSLAGSAALALHLPIFEGGRLRAELNARYAQFDIAAAQYNGALLHAVRDVAQRLAVLGAVVQQQETQRKALAASRQAYELALLRYRHGLIGYLGVLQVQRGLLAQRRQRVELTQARLQATVALIAVLGGGYRAAPPPSQNTDRQEIRHMADSGPEAALSVPSGASPEETANGSRRRLLFRLALIVALTAVAYGGYWFFVGRYKAGTSDAYVSGNVVQVVPRVSGTVVAIEADDTDLVRQGQPLVKLDKTDSSLALSKAKAGLAESVRQVKQLFENVARLRAETQLRAADLARARQDVARRRGLAAARAISAEDLEHAKDAYQAARAALKAVRHQLAAATAMTRNTSLARHPMVRRAADRLRQAYVAWLRTVIPAPVTGYVAKRSVQLGQQVAPGSPLMAVIPLNQLWVEANFKEDNLARLRVGQPVTMHSDQYGGAVTFHGKVIGLGAGTGSAFALLPPQNATGNWIKIVQRVPVRISLEPRELRAHPLRVGLSMAVTVDIRHQNGPVLAQSAANDSRYATAAYKINMAPLDKLMRHIIRSNAGAHPAPGAGTDPR